MNDWNDITLRDYDPEYDEEVLELIGELNNHDCYSWSILKVYLNRLTGLIGYGKASGCSCNSWNCSFGTFKDLTVIGDWNGFTSAVKDCDFATATERIELIGKVSKRLAECSSSSMAEQHPYKV